MKFTHVLVIAAVIALAFSTAASAHVRQGMKAAGAAAVAALTGEEGTTSDTTEPSTSASDVSPAPEASDSEVPMPEVSESVTPPAEPDDAVAPSTELVVQPAEEEPASHGEAVSAVARDKTQVATKTLANGKTVTNHGQAVSAVAKSDAGKNGAGDDQDEAAQE
jgi:type IV secretory pathway VirB10-like protein